MDRYPIILWVGAAVLGKVGGQMMVTDPWVSGWLGLPAWSEYAAMAFFVAFVCLFAKWRIGLRKKTHETQSFAEAAVAAPVGTETA
jgi:predicted tellurium resistance membrane protein TerC